MKYRMKHTLRGISRRVASVAGAALMAGLITTTLYAAQWKAQVGAQSADLGNQALSFLPNEFWIHAGDSILFTFGSNELHTVSFLTVGQTRLPPYLVFGVNGGNFVGCPGVTPDGSSFDNSACVTSDVVSTPGPTYTVKFPSAGNFRLVCLIHERMTGAIHVLPVSQNLPYDEAFYEQQGNLEKSALLSVASGLESRGDLQSVQSLTGKVTTGAEAISADGGGSQNVAVNRFFGPTAFVHVGGTVEWTNMSPSLFHTVTFGAEPVNVMPPSSGLIQDSDGVLHATINSPNDAVNSGFLGIPSQEAIGQPETPPDPTRFRVTFTTPGVFNYICSLHDDLGMKGRVVVYQ